MFYTGLFKRVIPFLLTFAAGLFIASFFVSIAAPNFGGFRRGSHKMREYKRIKIENEQLRNENLRLKRELEEMREGSVDVRVSDLEVIVPPVPLEVPKHPVVRNRGTGYGHGSGHAVK